jgi:hypothetical protein
MLNNNRAALRKLFLVTIGVDYVKFFKRYVRNAVRMSAVTNMATNRKGEDMSELFTTLGIWTKAVSSSQM